MIFKEIMHSQYMTCSHSLAQDSRPRGHEITVLGHYYMYYILSLSDLCLGRRRIFYKKKKKISQYDLYCHALAQEPLPQGS